MTGFGREDMGVKMSFLPAAVRNQTPFSVIKKVWRNYNIIVNPFFYNYAPKITPQKKTSEIRITIHRDQSAAAFARDAHFWHSYTQRRARLIGGLVAARRVQSAIWRLRGRGLIGRHAVFAMRFGCVCSGGGHRECVSQSTYNDVSRSAMHIPHVIHI